MARVHLSFDNGPHPEGTPLVLELLQQRGHRASFFVLGKHLATDTGRSLAREIVAQGHRIGNHSYTHETPLGVDPRPDAVELELQATQDLLDPLLPAGEPRLFRPFGGGGKLGPHLLSPAARDWLIAQQATCVLWNSVPGDWLDERGWVDTALQQVESGEDHVLVVLHDILPGAMGRLPIFLDALHRRGHTVVDALPESCLPLRAGLPSARLPEYVAQSPPHADA